MALDKEIVKKRRRARKMALQALYQRLLSEAALSEIEAQFRAIHPDEKVDIEYFCRLIHGTETKQAELDALLLPFLDRPIESLNPIELVALRLGAFELVDILETPYRVVLDEMVSITKTFGSDEGHRYVNGVLNNVAKKVRKKEMP